MLKERLSLIRNFDPADYREAHRFVLKTMERVTSGQDRTQLSLQLVKGKRWKGFLLLENHSLEKLLMWRKQVRVYLRLPAKPGSVILVMLALEA